MMKMLNLWKFYGVHNFSGRLDFHKILVLCFFAIPNILSLPPPLAATTLERGEYEVFWGSETLKSQKSDFFVKKWYFCEKVTFLRKSPKKSLFHEKVTFSQKSNFCTKTVFPGLGLGPRIRGKSLFCEKVTFLWKSHFFVKKWHFREKVTFLWKSHIFVILVF